MKVLEIKRYAPPGGGEFVATAYPGPGLYLLPDDRIALVYTVPSAPTPLFSVTMLAPTHGLKFIDLSDGNQNTGIDVHRLFDQMITLTKSK